MTARRQATYSPAVFNVGNMRDAKNIILTIEDDGTTDQRWERETPYLLSLIEKSIPLNNESVVLDYGCGIGRMSKALIDGIGCRVVGVDISRSMRALAADYVKSDRFFACAPDALDWLGIKFDAALAVWVLQHCYEPQEDIVRINAALGHAGKLFVVNDRCRVVPTVQVPWVNDGLDIVKMLDIAPQEFEAAIVGKRIATSSYWAVR